MNLTATLNVTQINLTATFGGTSVSLKPVTVIDSGGGGGDMLAAVYDPANKSEQLLGISDLIDDDTFATATATNIPSAESVKAYVDANAGGGGSVQTWQWKGLMSIFAEYYYSWNNTRGAGDTSMTTSFIGSNESLMAVDYQSGSWGCVDFDQTIVKFRMALGKDSSSLPATFLLKMFKCTYNGSTQLTRVKLVDVNLGSLDKRDDVEVLAAAFSNTTLTKGDFVYLYIGTAAGTSSDSINDIQFTMETTAS